MRTLTLELLRHGPAHNQLLSPLTQYLALCENHPAVTLQLPIEHNQMLHRLGALSYRLGEESRAFQLHDTARLMADLLAGIPGLTADMNRRVDQPTSGGATQTSSPQITHLRLVLSASELALLPFELALSPPGCPGEDQPLLLQTQSPVCITRETRRVPEAQLLWPAKTRVLLVLAAPEGVPAVPALAHLLALRQQLAPWVGRPDQLPDHLTVLSHASLESIAAACASRSYTHVHILAHGCEYADGYDTRFGLMLHQAGNPNGPADITSGERLASALTGPAVVTLASCNSGNGGTVAGVGASIAHALHQAGIPMVIASQFPLSFGGSVRMVEALYGGLLWGEDPRDILVDLRRQLHAQFPDTHDWASLTAYSSLPADFDAQLATVQIQRAMRCINVALEQADATVSRISPALAAPTVPQALLALMPATATATAAKPKRKRAGAGAEASAPGVLAGPTSVALLLAQTAHLAPALAAALERVRQAKQRLEITMARQTSQRARILGLLASTEKREAALSHECGLRCGDSVECALHQADMWASLARARKLYFSCYAMERTPYWTTQYLSLCVVMRGGGRLPLDAEAPGHNSAALWNLAEVQALHDLSGGLPQDRTWALGNLIELYLLAPAIVGLAPRSTPWATLAANHAQLLVDSAADDAFELGSTRRQVSRYGDWYNLLGPTLGGGALPAALLAAAQQVLAVLPADLPI